MFRVISERELGSLASEVEVGALNNNFGSIARHYDKRIVVDSLPTADESLRGKAVLLGGENLYVCLSISGTLQWLALTE